MATTCSQCKRAFPDGELLQTAEGLLCSECRPAPQKLLGPLVIAALVAGCAPFFFHITSSSSVTENGVVTQAVYRDWAAITGGALAAVLGLAAVASALKGPSPKQKPIAFAVGILGLGFPQLVRGFGL